MVSAEIPPDEQDAALVREFHVHHHSKYCSGPKRSDGQRGPCRFHYPKPLQMETFVDTTGRVHYRRRKPEDGWIVPYCLPLLRKYRCHINFEVANTSHIFQYLFKYIHKGHSLFYPYYSLSSRLPQALTVQNSLLLHPRQLHITLTKFKNTGTVAIFLLLKLHGAFSAFT